jgi:hypothetical protein
VPATPLSKKASSIFKGPWSAETLRSSTSNGSSPKRTAVVTVAPFRSESTTQPASFLSPSVPHAPNRQTGMLSATGVPLCRSTSIDHHAPGSRAQVAVVPSTQPVPGRLHASHAVILGSGWYSPRGESGGGAGGAAALPTGALDVTAGAEADDLPAVVLTEAESALAEGAGSDPELEQARSAAATTAENREAKQDVPFIGRPRW